MKKVILIIAVLTWISMSLALAQPSKYALAVYHFNLQYVAGGLRGLSDTPDETIDSYWEDVLEDLIIVESFEPVLDLFLAHSDWGANIELQGYFLEVLNKRHPKVLSKLKTLVDAGQIELISFHYSDQLFLAYPKHDNEVSISKTDEIASSLGLEMSPVVFTQEGQGGPGAIEFGAEHNRNIYVYPKNLYIYQYGDWENAPFYQYSDGVYVVFGPKGSSWDTPEISVTWTFLDDGEKLATNGMDPYFAPIFKYDPDAVAEYEAELEDLEADGYEISTISGFVNDALDKGYVPPDCPILLDGTWQPSESRNVTRWMGEWGLWPATERDNLVLTLNSVTSAELRVVDTLWGWAESDKKLDLSDLEAKKNAAWRHLLLAEDSDSTGWRPWRGEVEYSMAHAAYALALTLEVEGKIKEKAGLDKAVWIDASADKVSDKPNRQSISFESTEPPGGDKEVTVDSQCRDYKTSWEIGNQKANKIWRVTIQFDKVDAGKCDDPVTQERIKVKFVWDAQKIVYRPALSDNILEADVSGFSFEDGEFSLPLANGWMQLATNLQLVKDMSIVHLAANLIPSDGMVSFEDQTAAKDKAFNWVFYLLESEPQDAVEFADKLNIYPEVQR